MKRREFLQTVGLTAAASAVAELAAADAPKITVNDMQVPASDQSCQRHGGVNP